MVKAVMKHSHSENVKSLQGKCSYCNLFLVTWQASSHKYSQETRWEFVNSWLETSRSVLVLGQFADDISLTEFSPTDISLTDSSAKTFPLRTVPRRIVPQMSFPRTDVSPNGYFPGHIFHFRNAKVININ